ncbi:MAG: GTP 3',8-cyclase MoaA, partial [Acidimicrobiales bacterium]
MAQPLVDSFGRVHRDLRISVTDRCNFRCVYCMPEEGMDWTPRDELLTFEEIERIARVLVDRFSFDSIRLTGGEPTVRARLPVLVQKLSALGVDLAMTTNGATLGLLADDLVAAGLNRINISLDSLRADRFLQLTRRDALDQVLDGIDAALAAGFTPVKVNVVLMRGINDDEIVDFATFGRERGVQVRFIEFMPLDADRSWTTGSVMASAEIVAAINEVFPSELRSRGSDPAERHRYLDGGGEFGVIGTVTEPFCGSCDRVRLTADGQLRSCLFATDETDLRGLLRAGGTDDDLAAALSRTVAGKWA